MSFRYRVQGDVREAGSGRPLLGLVVRAYDADIIFDDFLGEARTDEEGKFAIVFTQVAFRDVKESRPDLYLRIFDGESRRELTHTRKALRRNAGVEERYAIEIDPARLAR
jgi:hypothetical protein